MILSDSIGMIPYTTCEEMANTFARSVERIRSAIAELGEATEALKNSFGDSYTYSVGVYSQGSQHSATSETAEMIIDEMKRAAWAALIDRLGIRKLMSSKRQEEMNDALHLGSRSRYSESSRSEIPEITPDSILDVLRGFVASAGEFMAEAVREEYDFWKPERSQYKTNCEFALGKRVIHSWMVERWSYSSHRGSWNIRYNNSAHVTALDRIFHELAGQGIPKGYRGPLADAITACDAEGTGETEFFRFRCCKNGNLHLEFRRLDLLDEFNRIAGRPRLPQRDPITGKAK